MIDPYNSACDRKEAIRKMIIDREKPLELHRKARGKIRIYPTVNIRSEEDLAVAYVQGGVWAARAIQENP